MSLLPGNFQILKSVTLIFAFIFGGIQIPSARASGDSLVVFVGEKISLIEVENPRAVDTVIIEGDTLLEYGIPMDSKFIARYKILQLLFGDYKADTIEFVVYDHYGTPLFSKFQNVLLYVEKEEGKFYHIKYLFDAVYKTQNGRWAGGYNVYDYKQIEDEDVNIKPERLKFITSAFVDITNRRKENIKEWFFKPYYKIKGNKAEIVWGNYVEDLFKLKQYGRLDMYFDN